MTQIKFKDLSAGTYISFYEQNELSTLSVGGFTPTQSQSVSSIVSAMLEDVMETEY